MITSSKKRRGISGLMQVAMIIGIVIIFAGILFAFASDIFEIQTTADSISLRKVFVQKVGEEAYLSASIRNVGTSAIDSVSVDVLVDTDTNTTGIQPFVMDVNPSPLEPGVTASGYEKIVDSDGDDIALTYGQDLSIVVRGNTTGGSMLSELSTVRVQ